MLARKFGARRDQRLRLHPQRRRAGDQIAFVGAEEIEHRHLHAGFTQPGAQIIGRQPG